MPHDAWITIYPNIYPPPGVDAGLHPQVIAHESTHLHQQSWGLGWWMTKYLASRSFRLSQEAQAFSEEIRVLEAMGYHEAAGKVLDTASEDLAGVAYFWAASSPEQARKAIEEA